MRLCRCRSNFFNKFDFKNKWSKMKLIFKNMVKHTTPNLKNLSYQNPTY